MTVAALLLVAGCDDGQSAPGTVVEATASAATRPPTTTVAPTTTASSTVTAAPPTTDRRPRPAPRHGRRTARTAPGMDAVAITDREGVMSGITARRS